MTRECPQEPLSPSTALLRHIVDDNRRTWRTVILIIAATLCLATIAFAIALAGLAGAMVVGSGSLTCIIRMWSLKQGSRS